MKFDFCIGNPPYQGENHTQLYPDFYLAGRKIASCLEMIFPTGWQAPKNANNLRVLNNKSIKEDPQIVFINNKHNAFLNITGAEWTNIIMWKEGYDNGLNGKQKILTDSKNESIEQLKYDVSQIEKPKEILELFDCVKRKGNFESLSFYVSSLKPYGLRTDFLDDPLKYNLPKIQEEKKQTNDILIYGLKKRRLSTCYIPFDYPLPKRTLSIFKYKVFVPYAWGGGDSKAGLGGTYANIILGKPNEICTETFLETGCFEDFYMAQYHAKYLMTKFLRALLYINKFSQHSTRAWGAIPVQTYEESWWNKSIEDIDKCLMQKYNVPQNIQDFVFKNGKFNLQLQPPCKSFRQREKCCAGEAKLRHFLGLVLIFCRQSARYVAV